MNRVCILLDSSNFFHLVLKKLKIREFDYDSFTAYLAKDRTIINRGKRFYVGTVREKQGNFRSIEAMSNQTRLFTKLKETGNWEIKTSKLRMRNEKITIDDRVTNYKALLKAGFTEIEYERAREKGIDVKLATDLIICAIDNQYDIAILISSDTDLVPAVDWVRRRCKKIVEYIGFSIPNENNPDLSTKPTPTMIAKTDIQRVLVESDIRPFEIKTQTPLI